MLDGVFHQGLNEQHGHPPLFQTVIRSQLFFRICSCLISWSFSIMTTLIRGILPKILDFQKWLC
jgi:hypothetical protein